jgi:hypothetical protein
MAVVRIVIITPLEVSGRNMIRLNPEDLLAALSIK